MAADTKAIARFQTEAIPRGSYQDVTVRQQVTKGYGIFVEVGSNDKTFGLLLPTLHIVERKEEYEGRRLHVGDERNVM
jgi:hypothetical protein